MFNSMLATSGRTRRYGLIAATIALGFVVTACGGGAQKKKTAGGGDAPAFSDCVTEARAVASTQIAAADVGDGAQLYDDWAAVIGTSLPTGEHPLWKARLDTSVTETPEKTWRCKSCHGWNYTGALFSGANLVTATKTPENIFCAIKSGTADKPEHAFLEKLVNATGATPEEKDVHIWNLTKFITDYVNGVIDTTQYIATNKGIFNADVNDGATSYRGAACGASACHAADGSKNTGEGGLGGMAVIEPWELMHKVRFGDPGSNGAMIAYQFEQTAPLSVRSIANIIAWAQGNLAGGTGVIPPVGTPGSGSSGGGGSSGGAPVASGKVLGALIYDNLVKTLNKTTLTATNPLWTWLSPTATPDAPSDSWRCSKCHGWDYRGQAGVNAPVFPNPNGPSDLVAVSQAIADGSLTTATVKNIIKYGYKRPVTPAATVLSTFHAFGQEAGAPLKNGPTDIAGPGLSDVEIDALIDFIQNGVIDTTQYIRNRGAFGGDATKGAAQFVSSTTTKTGACGSSACHGPTGNTIDFVDGKLDTLPNEFVGTIALDNPWEFFHKARWGQPGSSPTMGGTVEAGLPDTVVLDLLRYAQDKLPTQ